MNDKIHSCFISYRHPASADGREAQLIRHVVRAIKDHIEVYTHDYDVYYDDKRLVPGYAYDEELAKAICRSACMFVIYWPSYLESEYCLKEVRTMLDIEQRRRARLGQDLHGCRLFVPIILRGKLEDLPADLHQGCQYLDYTKQATRPNFNIGDDPEMSEKLFKIAEYVKQLCLKMKAAENDLFNHCTGFQFAVAPPASVPPVPAPPFPGR